MITAYHLWDNWLNQLSCQVVVQTSESRQWLIIVIMYNVLLGTKLTFKKKTEQRLWNPVFLVLSNSDITGG